MFAAEIRRQVVSPTPFWTAGIGLLLFMKTDRAIVA
jgi:hypothetical protein